MLLAQRLHLVETTRRSVLGLSVFKYSVATGMVISAKTGTGIPAAQHSGGQKFYRNHGRSFSTVLSAQQCVVLFSLQGTKKVRNTEIQKETLSCNCQLIEIMRAT